MFIKLLCCCYIVMFLTQSAIGYEKTKWKGKHSKERPSKHSKERPGHGWHSHGWHSHGWHSHSKDTSEESTEEYDAEDSQYEGEASESQQTGESESRTVELEGSSSISSSEYNGTTAYSCINKYCYHTIRNTTYPPQCPFQDSISYAEYSDAILPCFASARKFRFWINVKRNHDYGYYEWLELGDDYGNIIDEATYNGGDCVTLIPGTSVSFETENCSSAKQGLCIHRMDDASRNFCDVYEEICGTSSKCYCYANEVNYLCQTECKNYVNTQCDICQEKFENYPKAKITLQFIESQGLIYVTVLNWLKLIYVRNDTLIFCFTDVYEPSTTAIKYKYHTSEINLVKTSDDAIIYTIVPRDLGPGNYWCQGFEYPDGDVIESNTIVAGISDNYGTNFVLQITVELGDSFTFLPYNIHTRSIGIISEVVNSEHFQSIRPSHISEIYEVTHVNVSLHITTTTTIGASQAYLELIDGLNSLNSDEIIVGTLTNSIVCTSDVTIVNNNEIVWPEAVLGQVVPPNEIFLQDTGVPIMRQCMGSFQSGAVWSDIIGTISTKSISATTLALFDLNASDKTAEELNVSLKEILNYYEDYVPYDVYLVALILQTIAQSKESFDLDLYMENVNTIVDFQTDLLSTSQILLNATDIILYNLDLALIASIKNNKVNENDIHNVTVIIAEFLQAQVVNLKANNGIIGIAMYEYNGNYIMTNITQGTLVENINFENLVFATFLPPILLNQILQELQHLDEINMVTAIFLDGALFNTKNTSITHDGFVVSLFIDRFDAVYLRETIPIIFIPRMNEERARNCGYWKYGIDDSWMSIFGSWNIDKYATYDDMYSMCNYTHTTHFALLVNGIDNAILNIISIIGCVLSIFGLVGIFATATISKSWREGSGTKILLNYSAAILIQMLVLLFSDLIDGNRQKTLCVLTGITLHYTTLSQFLWMLIISYLQYRKFVQVLVHEPDKLLIKSCLFAWGAPIILIVIVAISNISAYRKYDTCYLSGNSLYVGLFLPIIAVVSFNVVLFILIFKSVLYKKTQAYGVNRKLIGLKVKLAVILFFLMGFSWIFGLFAGLLKSLFLSYIFSLTATIQGLVMYLYFVVCNKTTRNIWIKKINKMRGALNSTSKLVNEDTNTSDEFSKYKK